MKTDGALCILYLLIFGCTGALGDITCKATTNEQETTVECSFGDNIGTTKSNFNVQFYYPTLDVHPETKLMCNWMSTGSMKCKLGPGVEFDEVVSDKLTIRGPPAVDKVGGMYVCQVVPRSTSPVHPCNLTRVAETTTPPPPCFRCEGDKTALILAVLSVVLFGIFICVLVLVVCCCKERIYKYVGKRIRTITDPERQGTDMELQNRTAGYNNPSQHTQQSGIEATEDDNADTTEGGQENRGTWQRIKAFFSRGPRDAEQPKPDKAGEGPERDRLLKEVQATHPSLSPESGPSGLSKEAKGRVHTVTAPNTSQGQGPPQAPAQSSTLTPGGSDPVLDTRPLQILVIGKAKNGKSLLANNIIGEDRFEIESKGKKPTTKVPEEHTAKISGRDVKVVDTSGLSTLNKAGKQHEVNQWKEMTAAGPRVILFLVRCDNIKAADLTFFQEVKQLWGDTSFCQQMTVVLTFADKLKGAPLKNAPVAEAGDRIPRDKNLDKIISETGNRCIFVTNEGINKEKYNFGELIVGKVTQQAQMC